MGNQGTIAAVFHRHQPGIALYNDKGQQIALLFHPGQGVETDRVDENGQPTRRFYQADVAVDEKNEVILIADTINQTMWFVDFSNQLLGKAALPFLVTCMYLNKEGIYLKGRSNEFGRYTYNLKKGIN